MLGCENTLRLALFAPLFLALEFGGEALFCVNTRRTVRRLLVLPLDTLKERVSAVLARLAYGLGIVASFALGSVGAMPPFGFSVRLKQMLLALLLCAVVARLAAVGGRLLMAQGAPRLLSREVEFPHPAVRDIRSRGRCECGDTPAPGVGECGWVPFEKIQLSAVSTHTSLRLLSPPT